MSRSQTAIALLLLTGLLLVLSTGCAPRQDFDSQLGAIAAPYQFNTVKWEAGALLGGVGGAFRTARANSGETDTVQTYFANRQKVMSLSSQANALRSSSGHGDAASVQADLDRMKRETEANRDTVQGIIKKQVRDTLAGQGIYNPADQYLGLPIIFPPVKFEMRPPPHVLIISARERIVKLRSVTLQQELSLKQMEAIEDDAGRLGVSALVVELGGFAGTYPAFVSDQSSLWSTIDTAAHEWLHQYLAFRPLGFAYVLDVLDIAPSYDIVTMNETAASMFGREVASLVLADYYGIRPVTPSGPRQRREPSEFDREMRQARLTVDGYLARGEVDQAEAFMEQERQHLATLGYYIRKLNQAYFAFNGTYADAPSSVSPIGGALTQLRSKQKSLKEFVNTVAVMGSRQDLLGEAK